MRPVRTTSILKAALLSAAALSASSAKAALITADFSGTVTSEADTAYAVGSAISGTFTYDTVAGRYTAFAIGSYGLPAGAASYVPPAFASTQSVQFAARSSASAANGNTNTSLTVDLETTGFFNTENLASFTAAPGPGAVTTNPASPDPSFFEYSSGVSGSPAMFVEADLSSFGAPATRVPEPASLALLTLGVAGLAFGRGRVGRLQHA